MKEIIAVTLDLNKGLWSSGITQNAIYLAETLRHAGYTVMLLYQGDKKKVESMGYLKDFQLVNIDDRLKVRIDLIITLGIMLNEDDVKQLKTVNSNMKFVSYKCGNEFFSDMENILFGAHSGREGLHKRGLYRPDQIWSIPQMEETNLDYYKYMLNQENATVVPFIWSPTATHDFCKKLGYDVYAGQKLTNVAVMEPNISVFKNVLHPIVTLHAAYDRIKDKIGQFFMVGAKHLIENKVLYHVTSKSKMFKDKCISFDSRFPTMTVLNKHANVVFSWQMHNPLNYLYLDVAWMGFPVVHNGYHCKDVGYFYNHFDAEEAADVLVHAIETHETDKDYLERNRKAISRYLPTNKKLIEQYKELIDDVLNDRFTKRVYDSATNTVSKLD